MRFYRALWKNNKAFYDVQKIKAVLWCAKNSTSFDYYDASAEACLKKQTYFNEETDMIN